MLLDQRLQDTGDTKFENRVEDQVIKNFATARAFFRQITLANCFGGFFLSFVKKVLFSLCLSLASFGSLFIKSSILYYIITKIDKVLDTISMKQKSAEITVNI